MLRSREGGELARIQRVLQALIRAPGSRERVDASSAREIGCAPEQVRVLRGMVAARLTRELAREFPATRALLGATRFERAARAFVDSHPSRSYTLDGYGRRFPEHLRDLSEDGAEGSELAWLEREIDSARRAPAARRRRRTATPGVTPRVIPAPGARVCASSRGVEAVYASFERGRALPATRPGRAYLALFRRGATVERLRISRREATLLRALLRGESVEAAVARGVRAGLGPEAIRRALTRWVTLGLLLPDGARAGRSRSERRPRA